MKRLVILNIFFSTVLVLFSFSASVSFAQWPGLQPEREQGVVNEGGEGGPEGIKIENPLIAESIQELFQSIIDVILVFAVPLIVFFIIYAGFKYVTARGNPAEIQKAHMALLFALIGGLLILGARILIEVVGGTVDVFKK